LARWNIGGLDGEVVQHDGGRYCMSEVLAGWRAAVGGLANFRRLMEVF
jgi:hypothetical protein